MTTTANSSTEQRALKLLGIGTPPSAVALALGVEPSRISQLLADEEFSRQVTDLRFVALTRNNERDISIDSMEDKLIKKLDAQLPFMTKSDEILNAFRVINAAKRRGQSAPENLSTQGVAVTLVLPTVIQQKFQVNIHNQVIQVGDQSLVTIQSGTLLKQVGPETNRLGSKNEQRRTIELSSPNPGTTNSIKQDNSTEDARIAALITEDEYGTCK